MRSIIIGNLETMFKRKAEMHYYAIVAEKWESVACAIYAFLTRKTVSICEDKRLPLPSFLSRRVLFFQNVIGWYKGKDYELHKQAVYEPILSEGLELEKNRLIRFQNRIFNTDKVVNFYKCQLSVFQYEFLRDLFLIRQKKHSFCLILPKTKPYTLLADKYLQDNEYQFSRLLTILYLGTDILAVMACFIHGFLIKPVHRKPLSGLLLKELTWGFNRRGIRDNFLVDNRMLQESDYVFFTSKRASDEGRITAYQQAKERNYKIIFLDHSFNINRCLLKHIKNDFIFAFFYIVQALFCAPYLMSFFVFFLFQSTAAHRLFSFCKVSYYMSTSDYDDIVMTIVANQLGVRVFLYHWSDMTVLTVASHQHIAHNDLFLWGPIMKDFMYTQSKNENVYCIGCMFSNNFDDKSKKELREELGLDAEKPVVTFYDNSSCYGYECYNSVAVYEDFMQTVVDFAKKNPAVRVVIKPKKFIFDEKYKSLLKQSQIKILDGQYVFVGDSINASDVNVSMGMSSVTTISLLCGIPGLYYDNTENHEHPLSKYEGQLVFRDRESLFRQINGLLAGTIEIPEVSELKKYNVFDADPVDILRRYVKNGEVDDIYRL